MSARPSALPYGVVGRAHGVRGEAVLHPYNEGGIALDELDLPLAVELERDGRREPRTLRSARPAGAGYLVTFEGITAREQVPALTNSVLLLPRSCLPSLEDGEYYIEDLVGCAAVDPQGRVRGQVRGTYWNGAQDILSIVDDAGQETLVPAVPGFLLEVDLEGRRVSVDPHDAEPPEEAGGPEQGGAAP